MKFVCRLTFEDFVEAHRLHRKGSIWRQWDRAIGLSFLFLTAGVGSLIVVVHPAQTRVALPSLALAVFWALLVFVFPRMRMQHEFKRNPNLHQETVYEVSDDGVCSENANMRSQRNWKTFIRWAENGHMFMLYSSPRMFIMLPKRFLAIGEADQLRELLRRNISVG